METATIWEMGIGMGCISKKFPQNKDISNLSIPSMDRTDHQRNMDVPKEASVGTKQSTTQNSTKE
eukprot:15352816-Ditylum_brightwellii.AAC.1